MKRIFTTSLLVFLMACSETPESNTKSKTADESPKTESSKNEISKSVFSATNISSGLLGGIYLDAGDNTPIVIMVPGSGATDKDGNVMGAVSNNLKFLAQDLAENGISSVRVDKRGMFSSAKAGDGNKVTVDIYANDYRGWVKTMTEKTGQSCAYLLGHSEGGLMVTAAAIDQDNVCGVISVAAPGFRLSDVLRKQLKDNPANKPILDDAMGALDKLDSGQTVDVSEMHPALQQLFSPLVQDYMISLFQVDPAALLAKVTVPKIVIQGSHDIQVSVDDAKRLSETSGAELVILDGISHILKPAPAGRAANIQTYNSPDTPVDPSVTKAINRFILKTQ